MVHGTGLLAERLLDTFTLTSRGPFPHPHLGDHKAVTHNKLQHPRDRVVPETRATTSTKPSVWSIGTGLIGEN